MGNLSTVIKQRRNELGLTLLQIAEAVGVSEATVQRWESGNIKTLRHDNLIKLSEVLNLSPPALMGWDEPPREAIPYSPNGYFHFKQHVLVCSYACYNVATMKKEMYYYD